LGTPKKRLLVRGVFVWRDATSQHLRPFRPVRSGFPAISKAGGKNQTTGALLRWGGPLGAGFAGGKGARAVFFPKKNPGLRLFSPKKKSGGNRFLRGGTVVVVQGPGRGAASGHMFSMRPGRKSRVLGGQRDTEVGRFGDIRSRPASSFPLKTSWPQAGGGARGLVSSIRWKEKLPAGGGTGGDGRGSQQLGTRNRGGMMFPSSLTGLSGPLVRRGVKTVSFGARW